VTEDDPRIGPDHVSFDDEVRAAQNHVLRLSALIEVRAALMITLSATGVGLAVTRLVRDGGTGTRVALVLALLALLAAILAVLPPLRAWHQGLAREAMRPAPLVGADESAYLDVLGDRLERRSLRSLRASYVFLAAAVVAGVIGELVG